MSIAVAIVLAAGRGTRIGSGEPKAFLPVGPASMLAWSMKAAATCPEVGLLVVAVPPGKEQAVAAVCVEEKPVTAVAGGASRQASVAAALTAVPPKTEIVVCHDAARPFVRPQLFSTVIEAVRDADGAVPILPIPDTVKRVRDDEVVGTEPREHLGLAQTPQAFRFASLRHAHRRAAAEGREFTDDAAMLEWLGFRVVTVPGDPDNVKITTPPDLARAEAFLRTGGAAR